MKNKKVYYPLLNNYRKIENIFGLDFLKKTENDELSVEDFLYANDRLSRIIYGKTIASLIRNREIDKLDMLYNDLLSTMSNRNLSSEINLDDLGMVLIRPETFGAKEKYKKFLKSLKLKLLLEKDFNVCFEQYWILYHYGLKHQNSVLDFPTRTFNYIDNDVCLLVFTGNKEELETQTISDYLCRYKGKHGIYTPNTLRGDIAFNELKKYLISEDKFTREANVALDPIGAYRMLVRGKINSDRCHEIADNSLLFYSAQAVHIPNKYEINKDLGILCDEQDLEEISLKLKRK